MPCVTTVNCSILSKYVAYTMNVNYCSRAATIINIERDSFLFTDDQCGFQCKPMVKEYVCKVA